MRAIEDMSNEAKNNRLDNLIVGSMDVVALYPSIDQKNGGEDCGRAVPGLGDRN